MTVHALNAARRRGYRVAILTASPDGRPVYRHIGFQEYCWIQRYAWKPG